jgi:hypothetical protein
MNDNTILRIKVPAHLYESVKAKLTLTEAKKGGKTYGDWTVVKEKKLPKDGMKQVEEIKDDKKEGHSLEELKAAYKKLSSKIQEMENAPKVEEKEKVEESEVLDMVMKSIGPAIDIAKDNAGFLATVGGITGIAKMIADKIKQDPEARKSLDQKTGSGSTDTRFFEEKKKEEDK